MNYVKQVGMALPSIMVSIKIAELFPDIASVSIYDDEAMKWDSMIIEIPEDRDFSKEEMERGEYKVIYSPELFIWNTEKQAMDYINKLIQNCLTTVRTMSN